MLAVVFIFGAAVAPVAHADCKKIRWQTRWQPDPFGSSGGSLIRVPVCVDGAPNAKPKKKNAKPRQPTQAQLRALRYRPSEAVSATVRQRMIEQLVHGDQAEEIRVYIESREPMRQFNANVRAHGWSTRDVGDMYTEAYIDLWLVANGKSEISLKIVKAVRKELRQRLALDPKVGGARDASQQETAEWFGSWTAALAGSMTYLRSLGDPARVEEYREKVRRMISAPDLFAIDLTQIRLTRRGIARR